MKIFTEMPMHSFSKLVKEYPSCPECVPFELLDENQAQSNHSQTLQRLAERGGLYPTEMIAVIAKRPFLSSQSVEHAIQSINAHLKIYQNNFKPQ